MTFRKRPFSLYQQKLKAVFVLMGIVILFYNRELHFETLESRPLVDWENTKRYSHQFDSLLAASKKPPQKLAPFHPNFTTAYSAYRLGLPSAVADSIAACHRAGKWISNKEEYQKVTGLADSSYTELPPFLNIRKKESKGILR